MERIIGGNTEEEGVQKFRGPAEEWQRMKSSIIIKTETVLGPLEKREGRK